MEGFWPIFFLLVVLKIPVLGALWLVWWASRAQPLPDEAPEDDGGFRFRNPSHRARADRGAADRMAPGRVRCPTARRAGRSRVIRPPAPARAGLAHARGSAHAAREHSEH